MSLISPSYMVNSGVNSNIMSSLTNQTQNVGGRLMTSGTNLVSGISSSLMSRVLGTVTSSAQGVLGTAVGSVSKNVSSGFDDLFGTTKATTSGTANVKSTIPDPVADSFGKKTPQSSMYATNSLTSQINPVNFDAASLQNTTSLALSDPNLSTVAQRYGTSTPNSIADLTSLNKTIAQSNTNQQITGSFSDLNSIAAQADTNSSLLSSPTTTTNSPMYSEFMNNNAQANSLLGSNGVNLSSYYQAPSAGIVDDNGNPIDGLGTDTTDSLLSGLGSLAKAAGCDILSGLSGMNGLMGSSFNALLSLLSNLNLWALLGKLLDCPQFKNANVGTVQMLIPQAASSGYSDTTNMLVNSIGGGNVPNPTGVASSLVLSPNLTARDTSNVNNVLGGLNVTPQQAFNSGNMGNQIVWNTPTVTQAQPVISNSLIGNNVVPMMGGTPLSLDSSGNLQKSVPSTYSFTPYTPSFAY